MLVYNKQFILSLCSCLNVSDKASHPYKIIGKIIVLYISNVIFSDRKLQTKGSEPSDSQHSWSQTKWLFLHWETCIDIQKFVTNIVTSLSLRSSQQKALEILLEWYIVGKCMGRGVQKHIEYISFLRNTFWSINHKGTGLRAGNLRKPLYSAF
jgi:hypothetical protein